MSIFDNNITLLHKYANSAPPPSVKYPNYLILVKPGSSPDEVKFETLLNVINSNLNAPPRKLYDYVTRFNGCIEPKDLAVYYYQLRITKNPGRDAENIEYYQNIYKEITNSEISGTIDYIKRGISEQVFKWGRYYEANQAYLNLINEIQAALNIKDFQIADDHQITATSFLFNPVFNNYDVEPIDGIDIFNVINLTQRIPSVIYVDSSGKEYTKVFNRNNQDTKLQLTNILIDRDNLKPDHIYFKVWYGDGIVNFTDSNDYYFHEIVYNLKKNELLVKLGSEENTYIFDELLKIIPGIELGDRTPINFNVKFTVPGIEYNEPILLDMLLNDKVLSAFFEVNDHHGKPSTSNKIHNVRFHSLMYQFRKYWRTETDHFTKSLISSHLILSNQPDGIHVEVDKISSKEYVGTVIQQITTLLNYYHQNKSATEEWYNKYIPEFITPEKETKPKESEVVYKNPLQKLRALAPKLFGKGYSTACQNPAGVIRRPVIVEEDEYPDREKLDITYEGKKLNFACLDAKNKYPNYIKNPDPNTSDEYPCTICCSLRKQSQEAGEQICTHGRKLKIGGKQKVESLEGDKKFLQPGRVGNISTNVSETLKNYRSKAEKFYRFGVINGPLSILHAVSIAVSDPVYAGLLDADREIYVKRVRNYIIKETNPALYKQELYDLSERDIDTMLFESEFFDPYLFYRGIEEAYQINLFVFANLIQIDDGILEIPRYRHFHARPQRNNRPVVLIYKTVGTKSETLDYPQCELIIEWDGADKAVKIFDGEMYEYCHQELLQKVLGTYTWTIPSIKEPYVTGNVNLYYYIDQLSILGTSVDEQYIDSKGKMRGLNLTLDEKRLSIFTFPGQPENLPTVDLNKTQNVHKGIYSEIIDRFGEPKSYTCGNGYITGLWYSALGIDKAWYIPIENAIPSDPNVSLCNLDNPTPRESINLTERWQRLKWETMIIVQLVEWAFSVWASEQTSKIKLQDFLKYIKYDSYEGDSLGYYDLTTVKRVLPDDIETFPEALKYLSKFKLSDGQQLVMYNQNFYRKMIYQLKVYMKTHVVRDIPEELKSFYSLKGQFKTHEFNELFIGAEDLNKWIQYMRTINNFEYFEIKSYLDINNGRILDPYYVQVLDGIYIIQNTQDLKDADNNLKYALDISDKWYTDKINYRAHSKLLDSVPAYQLYGINNGEPEIIQPADNSPYLEILYYGTKDEYLSGKTNRQYAAMLKLI